MVYPDNMQCGAFILVDQTGGAALAELFSTACLPHVWTPHIEAQAQLLGCSVHRVITMQPVTSLVGCSCTALGSHGVELVGFLDCLPCHLKHASGLGGPRGAFEVLRHGSPEPSHAKHKALHTALLGKAPPVVSGSEPQVLKLCQHSSCTRLCGSADCLAGQPGACYSALLLPAGSERQKVAESEGERLREASRLAKVQQAPHHAQPVYAAEPGLQGSFLVEAGSQPISPLI